jgi:hypothetical protein
MKEETVFSVLQQLRKLNSSASFKWVLTHFEPSKNPSLQVPSTAFKSFFSARPMDFLGPRACDAANNTLLS